MGLKLCNKLVEQNLPMDVVYCSSLTVHGLTWFHGGRDTVHQKNSSSAISFMLKMVSYAFFCMLCRTAVHASLFALYWLGGYLVQRKLLPIRVLLSAIGFTFSLVFATQGVVQTLADTRKVTFSMQR